MRPCSRDRVYPTDAAAEAALAHFRRAYLPEAQGPVPAASNPEAQEVEQGWVADGRQGRTAVIALDCPDETTGLRVVGDVAARVTQQGNQP
jgi:hypothetical protein